MSAVGYDVPAVAGMSVADIATPALIVDLPAFEANLDVMAKRCGEMGVALRPHGKAHKCPDVALLQVARGAVGICCQKVSEAEAFVRGGVEDVLVANEVTDPAKLARLAALARDAAVAVCVDDERAVALLSEAARATGVTIRTLVEVEVGAGRCGVMPGPPASALARAVDAAPHLIFGGIQAYHGGTQHIASQAERSAAVAGTLARTKHAVEAIAQEGLACQTVTGSGTGTYTMEGSSGVFTEVQPGTYAFMDADYGRIEPSGTDTLQNALFVLAQVMSTAVPGQAVCDAGLKAFALDSGLPVLTGAYGAARYAKPSDEHGIIADPDGVLRFNEKIRLIPGHCDPTFNLYDHLVAVRGNTVEAVWPISARGKGF